MLSHNILARVVPNHAVYEYLEVHGGQFFHAPMTEIPNQVPSSTFCRSVRVNSPSRFVDGYIRVRDFFKCRSRNRRNAHSCIIWIKNSCDLLRRKLQLLSRHLQNLPWNRLPTITVRQTGLPLSTPSCWCPPFATRGGSWIRLRKGRHIELSY
jgi:hypothetical protein